MTSTTPTLEVRGVGRTYGSGRTIAVQSTAEATVADVAGRIYWVESDLATWLPQSGAQLSRA